MGDENGALIGELYKQQVWRDNLIFREIEDEDNVLTNISTNIDNLASNVKDTQVRNYVNGFRLGAHKAYSYVILNKLSRIHESILSTIGSTPLVRVNKLGSGNAVILVKIESFNPGGSIKDRMAFHIMEQGCRLLFQP